MAKKQNAIGLSTLLLGFSVGTLGEQKPADVENIVKYAPPIKQEYEQERVEGSSLDLKSTSMDASLWDNGGGFLNIITDDKEDDVVYVSDEDEDDGAESYTDMVSSLLSPLSMDDNSNN